MQDFDRVLFCTSLSLINVSSFDEQIRCCHILRDLQGWISDLCLINRAYLMNKSFIYIFIKFFKVDI